MKNVIWTVFGTLTFCAVFFCTSCGYSGYEQPVEEEEIFHYAHLSLSDFSYTGTSPAVVTLAALDVAGHENDIHDWDGPHFNSEGLDYSGTYYMTGTTLSGATSESIAFSDIKIGGNNNDSNYTPVVKTALMIASDEDGSGAFSDGDVLMPVYVFPLEAGEEVLELSGFDFDPLSTVVADTYGGNNTWHGHIRTDITVPEEDGTIYLMIENGADFTAVNTFEKKIPLPSPLVRCVALYTFPDNVSQDYFILLFQDTSGDGQPTAGEPASESSPLTAITNSHFIDTGPDGNTLYHDISLTGEYTIQ